MKTTFIYALKELKPGEFFSTDIRYIGKSDDPYKRFVHHFRLKDKTRLGNWIRSLPARGTSMQLEILDEVPDSEWQFWEREYIKVFRAIGFDLTNLTAGGDGIVGYVHTPETRAKIGAIHRGKIMSAESRKKIAAAGKGRKHTPEAIEKQRATKLGNKNYWFGKKRSVEDCAAQVIRMRGLKKKNNTSGFVGVGKHSPSGLWRAYITVNKKMHFLGYFKKLEDAVFVRALAVDKYFSKI